MAYAGLALKRAVAATVTAVLVGLGSPSPASARPLQGNTVQEQGDLQQLVLKYRDTLPGRNTNAYVDGRPDEVNAIVQAAVTAYRGDVNGAGATLDTYGYDLVEFTNTGPQGGNYLVLRERPAGPPPEGKRARNWGLYVLNRDPLARDLAFETPHPLFDQRTPEMNIDGFLRSNACFFSMAGTHRYANGDGSTVSDMARNPNSLFQKMHETQTGARTDVVQFHGFVRAGGNTDNSQCKDVVLSNGTRDTAQQPGMPQLADTLRRKGFATTVYKDDTTCNLGATYNPQGQYTNKNKPPIRTDGRFFHLENEQIIRSSPTLRRNVVDAFLESVLGAPPAARSSQASRNQLLTAAMR